jgi:hypothetical protein
VYTDRFKLLAFLVEWHMQARGEQRFVGSNLHALIFAARYSAWLMPVEFESASELVKYNPQGLSSSADPERVHAFLAQRGDQLAKSLTPTDVTLYKALETEFERHLSEEFHALYKVMADA